MAIAKLRLTLANNQASNNKKSAGGPARDLARPNLLRKGNKDKKSMSVLRVLAWPITNSGKL
jgi:hypothetical protein